MANAHIRTWPFPHFYIPGILPAEYFARLRRHWPPTRAFTCIADTGRAGYEERYVIKLDQPGAVEALPENIRGFWREFLGWTGSVAFKSTIIRQLQPYFAARFSSAQSEQAVLQTDMECLLVRDLTHYAIGPHTDVPTRLITLLMYCPDDDALRQHGTSVYLPKDENFRCIGLRHYGMKQFNRVYTAPFLPNSLFGFVKTDNSFHGVEPVLQPNIRRDLILFNIRLLGVKGAQDRWSAEASSDTPAGLLTQAGV